LVTAIGCGDGKQEAKLGADASAIAKQLRFIDMAADNGVNHIYESGHTKDCLFPEIFGGGGALFDFDNDGDLDLYLVQGGSLGPENRIGNRLLENDGTGKFIDVSNGSGTEDSGYGMGVAAGDFDNDGLLDLYVTNVGPNTLLKNLGDGKFASVTQSAGVGDSQWGTSAAFINANGDEFLDLYVCNYVAWSLERDLRCVRSDGVADYCSPNSYNRPTNDILYINNGDGTFKDASLETGIRSTRGNGLGIVPADFNNDGKMDIFVANDMTENLMWINKGDGKFENRAMLMGCAVDRDGKAKAGMGTCIADLNFDGLPDLAVVNLDGQSDSFFENQGGYFNDKTAKRGLAFESRPYTRFGVGIHDFDNDGNLDMFLANGRVVFQDKPVQGDAFAQENLIMLGTVDGKFERVWSQDCGDVSAVATSRAAIFGDINNDGAIDIVVINKDSPAQVLVNNNKDNHWIGFDLRHQTGAIANGAKVKLIIDGKTHYRFVNPHYSYLASNDHRVQFGLKDQAKVAQVVVTWPSGIQEAYGPFESNQYRTLEEGHGAPMTQPTE